MITAVDTNVLLDILVPNEDFFARSHRALENAWAAGALVACDLVYAELTVHFSTREECDAFLDETGIRVEGLSREASFLAGRAWRSYRRQGGKRNRILTDFLVGAHAQAQATRLLTRDRGFYRELFPALHLLDPSTLPA
ncbi:MAG: type II toxin-antitoxin system VapC family toxin [Acidobacteriia bacterium]|nr:type II toxin-antitoxin system VapC family toxin [Terriglobia bacterium]